MGRRGDSAFGQVSCALPAPPPPPALGLLLGSFYGTDRDRDCAL
jgi:hypothetical protein